MSVLKYTPRYKSNVINLLTNNDIFVKLLNPKEPVNPALNVEDVLLGGSWIIDGKKYTEQGYVFDYVFADDTTTEEKPFVFVEVYNSKVSDNILVDFEIYVYVCCGKKIITLDSTTAPTVSELREFGYVTGARANRVDVLCDCIHDIINDNYGIRGIGKITPFPNGFVIPYSPNNKYYGKCLRYQIRNYNGGDDEC